MRYRNVEGVRMTEQTDCEHHNGNGNKKRTCACCARRGQSRTQHIATKDAEEKHEEEKQNMGFA